MNNLSSGKIQVIVVEDENIVAMDIERSLKRLGYDVPLIVPSGEEAILGAEKIMPDLILMDIQLKGKIDGIAAANDIQKLFNIPVIFLTAYADEETLQKAKEAGPYGYILKPFEEIELRTAIEVTLKKHKEFMEKERVSEEKLTLSEERFKLFIEAVMDYAIFILDVSGNIISWNTGASRIFGYSAEEAIGKNMSYFNHVDQAEKEKIQNVLEQSLSLGHYVDEGWRRRKDGSQFWAKITVTAIYDKNRNLYGHGSVIHDLTNKKQEEEALKKAIDSRDEFLSIASHELKTPLTLLQLQVQIFQRNVKKGDESQLTKENIGQFVELLLRQVQKLSFLVEDMLDISRIRTGRFTLRLESFNLWELIREILDRNKEQFIASACGLPEFVYSSESIVGTWDKMRIEQVVNNILNNAFLYAKGNPIKIFLKSNLKEVQLEFHDRGVGIAKEKLDKIFNRYERAVDHNEVSGLGLGLFIARQIVEAHGGKIWAESILNKGSVFYVVLPIISSQLVI